MLGLKFMRFFDNDYMQGVSIKELQNQNVLLIAIKEEVDAAATTTIPSRPRQRSSILRSQNRRVSDSFAVLRRDSMPGSVIKAFSEMNIDLDISAQGK